MGLTAEDLDRILKLTALLEQGAVELAKFIALTHQQSTQTDEQIEADAKQRNDEAKTIIDAL